MEEDEDSVVDEEDFVDADDEEDIVEVVEVITRTIRRKESKQQ